MKTIAIVANKIEFAVLIKNDIEAYFGDSAVFHVYTVGEAAKKDGFDEDAVVLSSWNLLGEVKEKISDENILEAVSFTLSYSNVEKMKALKGVKRALLVNYDYRICMQVISQLYEAGFRDIDFCPYFGEEATRDKSISVAVTPNEAALAPPDVTVYDIGDRTVEPICVLRLANKLGIEGIFDSPAAEDARKRAVLPQWGLDHLLAENQNNKNNIRAIIEYIEDGILLCDNKGQCYMGNEKAKELLQVNVTEGLDLSHYVPVRDLSDGSLARKTSIAKVKDKDLVFTVSAILSKAGKDGNLVVVKNFEEAEEQQHRLRNKILGSKHQAQYTFADMKGESKAIQDVIKLAKRIAKSNSSVVIFGESGTGKEVLAQSIHNASARRAFNFVALNCAAIPENLMESELFGYEYGAFTGARKDGKIGYFELAHKGTIFFDEVEEMPLSLQGKLLRVIEERKIAKIGSSKLIDVDVRIIAATNKNLKQMVKDGKLRQDLYYRLNVLPIKLPNLNQRGRDVLLLFSYFREHIGGDWTYDSAVERWLLSHKWNGNIREVRNTVEYLDNLGKTVVTLEDLPEDLIQEAAPNRTEEGAARALTGQWTGAACSAEIGEKEFKRFILREGEQITLHRYVLEALKAYKDANRNAGRSQVKAYMDGRGLPYTQAEIRNSLQKLSSAGYVRALRGRGGSAILAEGELLLEGLKGFLGY